METCVALVVAAVSGHYSAERKCWRSHLHVPLTLYPFKLFCSYSLRVRTFEMAVVFRKPHSPIYVLKKTVEHVGILVDLFREISYHLSAPFLVDTNDWDELLDKHFVPGIGWYQEKPEEKTNK